MCGFVVCLGDVQEDDVKKATQKIKYRGPDDTNYFFDKEKRIFIGHNRLSIMDPEFGRQPLTSDDKKIIIACHWLMIFTNGKQFYNIDAYY